MPSAKLEALARAVVETTPGEWAVQVDGEAFNNLDAALKNEDEMADTVDIKIAIAEKLAAATTARDAAEEKVKRCADQVRLHLEKVARAATVAAETYIAEGSAADHLDPSTCLLLAERLEQADHELTHAMNDRAARRREVELLETLIKVVKGK